MMMLISALAALSLQTTTPTPAPAPGATPAPAPAPLEVDIPPVTGATVDPTCGGRAAVARQATCVVATQAAMQGISDQYDTAFKAQGWLAAAGEDNLIVYVKRKEGGGCTAFQLLAFADDTRAPAPEAPGYFAFAAIPGDICASRPAATSQ